MADLRGVRGTRPPPIQILSISCSFWEKFGKIICWRPPPPRRVGVPTSGKSWIRHWKLFTDRSEVSKRISLSHVSLLYIRVLGAFHLLTSLKQGLAIKCWLWVNFLHCNFFGWFQFMSIYQNHWECGEMMFSVESYHTGSPYVWPWPL